MKVKILILKRNHLLSIIFAVTLLFSLLILWRIKTSSKALNTLNPLRYKEDLNVDLTGDGVKDNIYIGTKDNNYYVEILSNKKNYYLKCNNKLNSLGKFKEDYPINLRIHDISRDKIPEIFIQSSENGVPIQHIFTFHNKEFKDIFCSNGNILGFLDYKNNKTPKLITGTLNKGNIDLGYYMMINEKLENYSFDSSLLPGKKSIMDFIAYIESLPYGEEYKPDVFYQGFGESSLYAIDKISSECYEVSFIQGHFTDTKWDSNGNITEITWNLDFKGKGKDNNSNKSYSLKVNLIIDKNSDSEFKINSLSI